MSVPLGKLPQPSRCAHFRDITLEDPAPKRYGSQVRRHLLPVADSTCMSSQYGSGLNDGSTELAHLYLRAQLEAAEAKGMCGIAFFVDVSTAFASVSRSLLIPTECSRALLVEKLVDHGIEADLVGEVAADMSDIGFWSDGGASPHLVATIRDWFQHTWASLEGTTEVLGLGTGCSAGNPCADIFFALAFSKVLSNIRVLLAERGLLVDFDTAGGGGLLRLLFGLTETISVERAGTFLCR